MTSWTRDVGADGELADAVGVLVGRGVRAEVVDEVLATSHSTSTMRLFSIVTASGLFCRSP